MSHHQSLIEKPRRVIASLKVMHKSKLYLQKIVGAHLDQGQFLMERE